MGHHCPPKPVESLRRIVGQADLTQLRDEIVLKIISEREDDDLLSLEETFLALKEYGIPLVAGGLMDQPWLVTAVVFPAIRKGLSDKTAIKKALSGN